MQVHTNYILSIQDTYTETALGDAAQVKARRTIITLMLVLCALCCLLPLTLLVLHVL